MVSHFSRRSLFGLTAGMAGVAVAAAVKAPDVTKMSGSNPGISFIKGEIRTVFSHYEAQLSTEWAPLPSPHMPYSYTSLTSPQHPSHQHTWTTARSVAVERHQVWTGEKWVWLDSPDGDELIKELSA